MFQNINHEIRIPIKNDPSLELVLEPELSVINFRLKGSSTLDPEVANHINKKLLAHINARNKVFLTGCTVNGLFCIRVCLLGFRVPDDIAEIVMSEIGHALQVLAGEA